jgi:hypothetical protein
LYVVGKNDILCIAFLTGEYTSPAGMLIIFGTLSRLEVTPLILASAKIAAIPNTESFIVVALVYSTFVTCRMRCKKIVKTIIHSW